MSKSTFSCVCVPAIAILVLGPLASVGWSISAFQNEFYATYLKETSDDADDVAFGELVREAKCNLCHIGNRKKDRNTYGVELGRLLDHRADKSNVAKIRNALQQVAVLKSDPHDENAKTFGEMIAARELPGSEPTMPISPLDAVARSDEPLRDEYSFGAAVAFLDNAAKTWQSDRKCFACHSNYTFMETRPLVSWKTPVHEELRAELEQLGANPRKVSFRVMEGVMVACVLAQNDALTTGKLHPVTRQSLDYMWTLQSEDGGFDWLKSDQPPSEVDDHFGATMAVIGVGMAPDAYLDTPAAQAGLTKLREYLKNNAPVNLHQRSMLLLGSLHVDGIMTEAERRAVIDDLLALQKPNGGWGIVSLGNWPRHDGKPDDTECSDGYGTGFTLYVLRQAGLPADDPRIEAGIAWLKSNQRTSGRWFTRSQWEDSRHYLSRLGTSYAIRALVACGQQ